MSYNPHEEAFHESLTTQGYMFTIEKKVSVLLIDEGVQMRVSVCQRTVLAYCELWKINTAFPPLDIFYDEAGDKKERVSDGIHRLLGAIMAGIERVPCRVFRGSRRDAILHACKANTKHGLPRNEGDRRKAILTLLLDYEWGKRSNYWIAQACSCDEKYVRNIKAELEDPHKPGSASTDKSVDRPQNSNDFSDGENLPTIIVPEIKMAKRNGRLYPMRVDQIGMKAREARSSYHQGLPQPSQQKLICAGCEEKFSRDSLQSIDDFLYCAECAQAARMVRSQAREPVGEHPPTKKEEREEVEAPTKKQPTIQPSGNDSWCTPPELVCVISQFADIALDPCSNEFATTQASLSFTKEDDGLCKDWAGELIQRGITGLVYVNPPYDSETLEAVAKHCVAQHAKGLEILSLVPCKLDQEWWQSTVFDSVSGVCFVKGRIKFWEEGRPRSGAPMPCAFLYWGARGEAFQAQFSLVGRVFLLDIIRNGGKP